VTEEANASRASQGRPDASMTLLREVMERPLDAGYAEAAARRATGEQQPTSRVRHGARTVLVLVLAVAIGLGGVWAARELRDPGPGVSARQVLMDQIRERSETTAELVAQNTELRTEIQELQEQAFGESAAAANDAAAQLGVWTGTTPVTGPGVVVTMEDSDAAQAGEPDSEGGRVQDFDLQVVVNALWASGAESIAINGIRLTGATAIRTAGSAILVDLQPLLSPYTIEAIGEPNGMRSAFARSAGASLLSTLSSPQYGITSQLSVASELTLPAGTPSALELAALSEE
jgi:uncharacterized protein YlxW (UPF0749 family)